MFGKSSCNLSFPSKNTISVTLDVTIFGGDENYPMIASCEFFSSLETIEQASIYEIFPATIIM